MRITHLLIAMERIAVSLLTDKKNMDFQKDNVEFVRRTKAQTPFVWMLTEQRTFLYEVSDKSGWLDSLIKAMDSAEENRLDYCLYFYDCKALTPVFPRMLRVQANENKK